MKDIFTKLLSVLILLIMSCNKDEDNKEQDLSNQLIGKWRVQTEKVDGVNTQFSSCGGDILELKSNKEFTDVSSVLLNNTCVEDGNEFGLWTLNNRIIVLEFDKTNNIENQDWQINSITETELKITESSIEGEKVERTLIKM